MNTLTITGCIAKFGVPSTHAMVPDAEGRPVDRGSITLQWLPQLVEKFIGVPLLAPDATPRTIGTITRAWSGSEQSAWPGDEMNAYLSHGDFLLIEGEIEDSAGARFWLTSAACGLCPTFVVPPFKKGRTELKDVTVQAVRITRPGHSGFAESWIKFKDSAVRYQPPNAYTNPHLEKF